MNKSVTIIIPCRNEQRNILNVLESIARFDYPKELTKVVFVDGMSTDKTAFIIKNYIKRYKNFKLLVNKKETVPYALNLAIKESNTDYIVRLDAHSQFPKDYISKLIFWHEKLEAANVGGVCITETLDKNKKSNSIAKVLKSKFGVGNSLFRIGTEEVREVDTVPFGCFKRKDFDKYGFYNEKLTRNQDIELNRRIYKKGGKIFLVPEIKCTYYSRENFTDLARNNYKNGLWNMYTIYITKRFSNLSFRHFIPLAFVISLITSLLVGLFISCFLILVALILILYASFITGISIKLDDKQTNKYYIMYSFFTLHFSYGFGSLIGIIRGLKYL